MTVSEAILTLNANVLVACGRAGFSSATVKMIEDALDIIEDALKAQEPRVMTLEEALEAECVYLDVRPHPSLQCECCILIKDEDGDIVPVNKGFWGSLEGEDYGTGWRCWTSRPDNATREATAWQGSSNL